MSSLAADIAIWGLLFAGIVFGGLGITGLGLFPDTRSRMFTAFRASAISLGATAFAALVYGYAMYIATGSDGYPALMLRTLCLSFVLAAGTWMVYGIIRERTGWKPPEPAAKPCEAPDTGTHGNE